VDFLISPSQDTDKGGDLRHIEKERIRRYRRYLYEAGAIDRPDKGRAKVIDSRILATQKNKEFEITIASRLRYRTRCFTDCFLNLVIIPHPASNLT
jgi:hypothetical protein